MGMKRHGRDFTGSARAVLGSPKDREGWENQSHKIMTVDSAPLNRGRIFVLSLLALFTAGAAVSLRAATAVHMRADYLDAIDPAHAGEMVGAVLGAAFAGFAVTLLLVSAVLAKIGFGRALVAAARAADRGLYFGRLCRFAGRCRPIPAF